MTAQHTGPRRLNIDADDAGRGLGQLVLAILDVVRELLERQALRRMDAGSLSDDEVERVGQALEALEERFVEVRAAFATPRRAAGPGRSTTTPGRTDQPVPGAHDREPAPDRERADPPGRSGTPAERPDVPLSESIDELNRMLDGALRRTPNSTRSSTTSTEKS